MPMSAVTSPVRGPLKHVKNAVGTDVRSVEIFPYEEVADMMGLTAFTDNDWLASFDNGNIIVDIFTRVPISTIEDGDGIQYELAQSGTWVDSGETWVTNGFTVIAPALPSDIRIRYRRGRDVSPPSNVFFVNNK